ncbi:MAG TPA: nitroreductase family deazaflavin-dependent oxidoreductase [Actinomycetes bacterium]|nr:nitroreductase family deazaflavin-dependent oxidoreductase [Actinomycetes bacterium]
MLYGEEHVRRYIETDGREGHDWRRGAPVLLVTTTGRKTGRKIIKALIYQPYGDDYLIVASNGGLHQQPEWYLNLDANPEVEVQVRGDRFKALARTATPEEKPDLWRRMVSIWPDYDEYQKRTDRPIPVVILERQ